MDRIDRIAKTIVAADKVDRSFMKEFEDLAKKLRFKQGLIGFDWALNFSYDGKEVDVKAPVYGNFPVNASDFATFQKIFESGYKAYKAGIDKFKELGKKHGVKVTTWASY